MFEPLNISQCETIFQLNSNYLLINKEQFYTTFYKHHDFNNHNFKRFNVHLNLLK